MRRSQLPALLAALGMAALALPAAAQESFDACNVFTQEDAGKAMAAPAAGEPANPKAKRPKVVLGCTYTSTKDGKPIAATAQFRITRTPDEAAKVFDEARLQFQTKPMLISGADAFWSGKTGQMHVRKGKTWVTLSVGPQKPAERDIEAAKRLAEILIAQI
jgi:hypothetical protein